MNHAMAGIINGWMIIMSESQVHLITTWVAWPGDRQLFFRWPDDPAMEDFVENPEMIVCNCMQ